MPKIPSLNDALTTLGKMKVMIEKLRRRQSGIIEAAASSFPHRVSLVNFRAGDEIAIVASGWCEEGKPMPLVVHTAIIDEDDGRVLEITPHGPDGERLAGSALVHVAWIAMA